MEITKEKKKPGLPARLTPMQRKFAEILVFAEGHNLPMNARRKQVMKVTTLHSE